MRLHLHPHTGDPITVCVEDQVRVLSPGEVHMVALAQRPIDNTTSAALPLPWVPS